MMKFLRKLIMASSGPALVTVPNVPMIEVGVEYQLSTGPKTFTPEDLKDAMMAANEDHSIPSPRAGIGHVDPRFNDTSKFDGTPAFGRYENLRLSETGMTLYGDWLGCPHWLASLGAAAYPGRSIEGYENVEAQSGKKYGFVLTACKSLGVVWPGITTLEDLPLFYGETMPPGVELTPEGMSLLSEAVAATAIDAGGGPLKVNASANLDKVRVAFYNKYVPENQAATWWWIRQVLTDPNQLVVEDDESKMVYTIPFTSDDVGNVSFMDAQAVKIDYVPIQQDAAEAATIIAATLAHGRTVLASWTDRAESRPDTTEGGRMDPKEVRRRLGLSEDASDDEVTQAYTVLGQAISGGNATPLAAAAPPEGDNVVPLPVTPEVPPEAAPAPAVAATQLPPGTVLVEEDMLKQMQADRARFNGFLKEHEEEQRDRVVSAAISLGKIPPARKEHWLTLLKEDPEGTQQTLAALAPNVVPIEERGHGRTMDAAEVADLDDEKVTSWTHGLFPETVAASGGRSRITTDGKSGRQV